MKQEKKVSFAQIYISGSLVFIPSTIGFKLNLEAIRNRDGFCILIQVLKR